VSGRFPYLCVPRPFGFAHRGGAALFPENTLEAIRGTLALGFRHVETDVHLTRDGVPVLFHDTTVDRTTNGAGRVGSYTLAELRRLDAGYRFRAEDGTTPFRGRGVRVPTLEEALAVDPSLFLNLEMKHPMARELFTFIEEHGVHDRVLVAAAEQAWGDAFRAIARGRVATSPGYTGVLRFWLGVRSGLHRAMALDFDALQVPARHGALTVVDRAFVDAAHEHGVQVHVWTIDDPREMERLFSLGVDAVMSDRPDRLAGVLQARATISPTDR
jgi:glycerophosphoryl diester phosphodiesterase